MTSPTRSLFTPQRSAQREEAPDVVQNLAIHLKTSVVNLRQIHRSTIELAFKETNLSADARAAVDVWLTCDQQVTKDPATILADQVRRQQDQAQWPWLAKEDAAKRQICRFADDWAADSAAALDSLKDEFCSRAKNKTLGAIEALVGQYCLYCPDKEFGNFLLMSLLLRVPTRDRVPIHNWMVVSDWPRATTEAYGASIALLQTPLFPGQAALMSQNMQLLEAEANPQTAVSATGAGGLALIQASDGTYGVDTSVLEADIQKLKGEVQRLMGQISRRQHQPQQQPQQHAHFSQGNQAFHQQNYRRRQQQQPMRPRGGADATDGDDDPDPPVASTAKVPPPPPPAGFQQVRR